MLSIYKRDIELVTRLAMRIFCGGNHQMESSDSELVRNTSTDEIPANSLMRIPTSSASNSAYSADHFAPLHSLMFAAMRTKNETIML